MYHMDHGRKHRDHINIYSMQICESVDIELTDLLASKGVCLLFSYQYLLCIYVKL